MTLRSMDVTRDVLQHESALRGTFIDGDETRLTRCGTLVAPATRRDCCMARIETSNRESSLSSA